MKKAAPPGWAPHQITHRVDGWVIDPDNEDRIPAAVAKMIGQAAPQLGGESVRDIKARMIARHNIMKRAQMRQRKITRMLSAPMVSSFRRPGGHAAFLARRAAGRRTRPARPVRRAGRWSFDHD